VFSGFESQVHRFTGSRKVGALIRLESDDDMETCCVGSTPTLPATYNLGL
jgi:hypothetical protein